MDAFTKDIREEAYAKKRQTPTFEAQVNDFLDGILAVKDYFNECCAKLDEMNAVLQELTWAEEEWSEENLKRLNEMIAASRDLHSVLIRQYAIANRDLRSKGIANKEIIAFKKCLDNYREDFETLEKALLVYPNDAGITTLLKELENLT